MTAQVVPSAGARPVARQRPATDYSQLRRLVLDARLLDRRYAYYAVKTAALFTGLAVVVAAFILLGDSWAQLGVAGALAVVLTQIIFLSHDAAHQQIFVSNRANELAAIIMGTFFGGVSLSWWNNKHNKHHAAPNQIGKDSDIAPSIVHFYPAENPPRSALATFLHRRQGWWFYPLLAVEMLNLQAQSVQALITRPGMRLRRTEITLLVARLVYPAMLFVVLSPARAVLFLAVQLSITGLYLGSSFAASHIGMPVLAHDLRIDFFRRQVLTSRNIAGGRLASFAMGGLNYQIEHHLFPSAPRPSLRKVRVIVRKFCADQGVTYHEVTIFRAWATVASYLNRVGSAGRDPFQCPMVSTLRPR